MFSCWKESPTLRLFFSLYDKILWYINFDPSISFHPKFHTDLNFTREEALESRLLRLIKELINFALFGCGCAPLTDKSTLLFLGQNGGQQHAKRPKLTAIKEEDSWFMQTPYKTFSIVSTINYALLKLDICYGKMPRWLPRDLWRIDPSLQQIQLPERTPSAFYCRSIRHLNFLGCIWIFYSVVFILIMNLISFPCVTQSLNL